MNPGKAHHRWSVWIATGLGAGYLPIMPGTYGSALGVLLYLGFRTLLSGIQTPVLYLTLITLAVIALTIWIVAFALHHFNTEDPQVIVLDEVAGQLLTLLGIPFITDGAMPLWLAVGSGFLLFRLLDTLKPYPIWKMGYWPGAWGVVADDLGAGLAGMILLAAGIRWFF